MPPSLYEKAKIRQEPNVFSCHCKEFLLLVHFKQNHLLLYTIISVENFCGGVCNLVLMVYMSSMCSNKKFVASHFAIFASIAIVLRTLLSGISGWIVTQTSWFQFFIISALLSLPSILCISKKKLKNPVKSIFLLSKSSTEARQ